MFLCSDPLRESVAKEWCPTSKRYSVKGQKVSLNKEKKLFEGKGKNPYANRSLSNKSI